eukprot:TRINITY_DN464_c0_g1_i1.p1 TRINITY_DN464_c0_g1~~TRINITY_DN464_c0_g1_i1.p1  ORF type:complete len:157 (-),score=26.23 TRINITY_DN464_c0_g1_i1:138-608(-)
MEDMTTGEPQWEWFNDSTWEPYDDYTSQLIEEAYVAQNPTITLDHEYFGSVGGYIIDVNGMFQQKIQTGYTRNIRRSTQGPSFSGGSLRGSFNSSSRTKRGRRRHWSKAKSRRARKKEVLPFIDAQPVVVADLRNAIYMFKNQDKEKPRVIEIFPE